MESNKDEAQKCIRIALISIKSGNFEKALRFAKKSQKLYPSKAASDLEQEILKKKTQGESSPNHEGENVSKNVRNNGNEDFSNLHGQQEKENRKYTNKQKELAERINRCKDLYEILGVSKQASEQEIKKAYRKMALQLHPDKNQAPGATDAFKSVGKAFKVLSDSKSRQHYDDYGNTEEEHVMRRSNQQYYNQEEFNAEELFNMFFGGGFPQRNMRMYRDGNTYYYERANRRRQEYQNRQQSRQETTGFAALIQFLPLIVMLLFSILGSFSYSDPVYSTMRHSPYIYQRTTSKIDVRYYVKSDFGRSYPKGSQSLRRFENNIEQEFLESLRSHCYNEKLNKEQVRRSGIWTGNKKQIKRSEEMTTPSCDKLNDLLEKYRSN